jgi:hypothetical protein
VTVRKQVLFIILAQHYKHADHIMFMLGLEPVECIVVTLKGLSDNFGNMELCRPIKARDIRDKRYMFVTENYGEYCLYLGWQKKQRPYYQAQHTINPHDDSKLDVLRGLIQGHRERNSEIVNAG